MQEPENITRDMQTLPEEKLFEQDQSPDAVENAEELGEEEGSLTFNPEGLRVLAVDDNAVCLMYLVTLLKQCKYEVTQSTNSLEALQILRERKHEFDIVITDLRMLAVEGLVLVQKISLEMDLPVVMLSADDNQKNILKAIRYGARDYIIKPPRISQIKNIWQHVVRRHLLGSNSEDPAKKSTAVVDGTQNPVEKSKRKFDDNKGKPKTEEESGSTRNNDTDSDAAISAATKKRRVNWTPDLHNKFIDAIEQIGHNDAVPMAILKVMNVPGLTRANVASHLQKFKNALKGQTKSAPLTQNGNSSMMKPAMYQGQYRYQTSFNQAQAYSMGVLNYGSSAQASSISHPNPRNQHAFCPNARYANQQQSMLINPSAYQVPTMLNNATLPHKSYPVPNMFSHRPVPQLKGINFSSYGNFSSNVTGCYSFNQTYPTSSAPTALPAQHYPSPLVGLMPSGPSAHGMLGSSLRHDILSLGLTAETQNRYPQQGWPTASNMQETTMSNADIKDDNFTVHIFETIPMDIPAVNNLVVNQAQTPAMEASNLSNNSGVQAFQNTPQEELSNANLPDDDDNEEINHMVKSFNCDGPPSL